MSTKSKEYQALELLGPGDSEPSWTPRTMAAKHAATIAALETARQMGASHVRCRNCTPIYCYGPKLLEGPDSMLCPCGKMREPYDCQSDEWMKA